MRLRTLVSALLFACCASPGLAQMNLGLDGGADTTGGGNSTATVTTQTVGPAFAGQYYVATVVSDVNVRGGPENGTEVIGSLHGGDTVSVRCSRGWCELVGNSGYVAQKFLTLGNELAEAQADGGNAQMSTAAADLNGPAATPAPAVVANFDGLWTVINADGTAGFPLILSQSGASVSGTLQSKDRLAKITGDIQGSKLSFTYDMLNGQGKAVASGSGYFTLQKDGTALNGVLMLNGLVVSNVNASR